MNTPKFDVSKLNLQVIDAGMNMFPDIFVNATGITFTKKVLEELKYPSHVQYSSDVENKVFAIKACRSIDTGAQPFSKPRAEQTTTLSCTNKNIIEIVREMMKGIWKENKRYKVTGFAIDKKTMIFVLPEGIEQEFYRAQKEEVGEK
jgi:hypothetical protein